MEWLEKLTGEVVGLDTAPLIYFIEETPGYLEIVRPFFAAMDRGDFFVVTSYVTLLEVLVHPFRCGNTKLVKQYRDILLSANGLTTMQLSQDIAEKAAKLRAHHAIRTPDAIQMATALHADGAFFLTNDRRLPVLPGLELLILDDIKRSFYNNAN